jgi:bis(5'-nucleosyl)-tetraphosphatase (symmetrical)
MYGNQPDRWDDELSGYKRLRVITNSFTRLRICSAQGKMEFKFKGEPGNIPSGYMPWFDVPGRASSDATIVCGHWSALGLKISSQVIALDTGCLWGGSMTAIRLEDRTIFQAHCSISVSKDW